MNGKELGSGVQLSRRDMIRRLMGGAGSSIFFAQTAMAHPICKYLTDGSLLAGADAQVSHAGWTPKAITPQENETLIVVAEQILPNSSKAMVNRFIDLLLSVDTEETRQKFGSSLAVFDQESMRRYGHPFKDVSAGDQQELLTRISAESTGENGHVVPAAAKLPSREAKVAELTSHGHFQNVKAWVVGAYYSSEVGMRELGWTGMDFYRSFPGCQHPDGHA